MTSPKRPIRVLLVDDERAAREGYAQYLTGHGFEVRGASTGREALTSAAEWLPDVIVLDLGLPDIDGWEVARRLKAEEPTMGIPIVAVTGAALPHEQVSAMRAGCDRHLSKPCSPADVLDAIQRSVGAASR
jgi:CheY-like chemotaxis protein